MRFEIHADVVGENLFVVRKIAQRGRSVGLIACVMKQLSTA